MTKIYYVPSRKITREYLLIKQGLMNNSRVELVSFEESKDFIFLFYTTLKHNPKMGEMFNPNELVFIDYHDRPDVVFPVDCLAYFKRSWVEPVNHAVKAPVSRPSNFYPLTFAIMDEFIINENLERDVVLSCMIRPHVRHPNRPKVLNFIKEMNIQGKTQTGELNQGTMKRFNDSDMKEYFRLLKRSRMVVTCNPNRWEGDHRTWEAFANGALVFVDKMYTPMTHPLIDGKHCIFYEVSNSGLEELREKILYYLDHTAQAEAIAKKGFDFTMKYHRASNRIDEILERIT